jgi:hypothetical protein
MGKRVGARDLETAACTEARVLTHFDATWGGIFCLYRKHNLLSIMILYLGCCAGLSILLVEG